MLRDPATFAWPKRNATIEIVLATAKHHATFQQAPLNSLLATLPEVLNLGLERADLKGNYSEALLGARALFHHAYRRLAAIAPSVTFRFVYASRGDAAQVAENVRARGEQIFALTSSLFSSSQASFEFVGAAELVALHRRTKTFTLSLPFLEQLSRERGGYVLLAKLSEYCKFVTDERGQLRRYLFDSNVRDYLGENAVNEDIGMSLRDDGGPEFWWLNNGVTILATGATVVGKEIQLQDVQIVNGLQTTESVFNHFATGAQQSRDRALLVKVVVSTDVNVRDQIIRATNNQSLVEPQSLRATDKVQRDIEEVLERRGWYYERRKNYFRNIGKPPARFVTPLYIAAGSVALVMRNPDVAGRLKGRFMRNPEGYTKVFSEQIPIDVWPVIADVLKRCEEVLATVRPHGGRQGERFLARSRNLLGLLAVARVLHTFAYSVQDLATFDTSMLTDELLHETWEFVLAVRRGEELAGDDLPSPIGVCRQAAKHFGLDGVGMVGQQTVPLGPQKHVSVTEAFIERVNQALPPQPWPPGTHFRVAQKLVAKASKVSAAIQELIARGKWHAQRDGVVTDAAGNVVAVDRSRVPEAPKLD